MPKFFGLGLFQQDIMHFTCQQFLVTNSDISDKWSQEPGHIILTYYTTEWEAGVTERHTIWFSFTWSHFNWCQYLELFDGGYQLLSAAGLFHLSDCRCKNSFLCAVSNSHFSAPLASSPQPMSWLNNTLNNSW